MSHKQGASSAVVLLLSFTIGQACAAFPEPAPAYARTSAERADASLHAISFYDAKLGIAAGDHGTILRTHDAGLTWHTQPTPVACRLNEVVWVNDRRVIAVGGAYDRITNLSRAVVIVSDDGGLQWRRAADQELPRLKSIKRRDDRVLVASGDWSDASLSNEFESRDGGITWQAADPRRTQDRTQDRTPSDLTAANQLAWVEATGQHVPIRAVDQVGPQDVWAVADHGVILHSDDGGQSWHARRGSGRQSVILMIASSPRTIAWSILGKESLEMRHRASALVLSRTNGAGESRALDLSRQVAATFGVAGIDSVDLEDRRTLGDAALQDVIRWIAVHRPAVVLLDQTISDAVRTQMIDASVSMKVDRIVEYAFSDVGTARGDTMLHQAAMLASNGILAGDLDADALQWIAPDLRPPTATILRSRYDGSGANRTGESVTAGLALLPARQKTANDLLASRRQLQIVQARMSESRRLDHLFDIGHATDEFLPALQSLLDQTAQEDRFRLLWNALRRTKGHNDQPSHFIALHQVVLDEIIARYRNTSAGQWAALRREAVTHSSEWNRLRESQRHAYPNRLQVVTASADVVPVSPFQQQTTFIDQSRVTQATATIPLLVPDRTPTNPLLDRDTSPVHVPEIDLSWEFHPAVLLAREASRQRGDDAQLQTVGRSATISRLATHRSRWTHLLSTGHPSVIGADQTTTPPRLDGLTDDPCWASSTIDADSQLQIAYDDQYVYVALRQPADQLRSDAGDSRSATTVRDQNLTHVDRMQLRIDTDKDLLTSLQFEFTDAGRTHDSVDGFAAWQPSWYVAAKRTGDDVHFELAILRRDLTDLPIHPGESWFISARSIPAGVQTPSQPMPAPNEWTRAVFR